MSLAIYASILFTFAAIFYSVGVWAEHIAKRLKKWHIFAFLFGVITDSAGTILMMLNTKGVLINAHTIVGSIGLVLMIFHLFWAMLVLKNKQERMITQFHKFSIFVWSIWMVAYISGAYMGMQMLSR